MTAPEQTPDAAKSDSGSPVSSNRPIALTRRVSSTHYYLQECPAADPVSHVGVLPRVRYDEGTPAAAVNLDDSSEADSEGLGDWTFGSPDLQQGLLPSSRSQQHQRSRLARQRGNGSGLLASLFGGRSSHTAEDPALIAARAADLLEAGGPLTFSSPDPPSQQPHIAAAAAADNTVDAACCSAAIDSTIGISTARQTAASGRQQQQQQQRCSDGHFPTHPEDLHLSAGASAAVRSSHFNEAVFNGGLCPAEPQSSSSHRSASVTLDHLMSRGKQRWQNAAQKVIAMKHITSSFRPGALQGLDVKRHCYDGWFACLHTETNITVVDYNKDQVEVATDISNATLPEFLKVARPEWSRVRWINVQGLSWDVITTLAVNFDLHPLSVEDIVHIPQRIKADYYPDYLYASVILLSVDHPSQLSEQPGDAADPQAHSSSTPGTAPGLGHGSITRHSSIRRTQSREEARFGRTPLRRKVQASSFKGASPPPAGGAPGCDDPFRRLLRTRLFGASSAKSSQCDKRAAATAEGSTSLQPMHPVVEQASIFLFKDGTLITMFTTVENDSIARRLLSKLEGFRSLLTDSEDASYLFNAVLDAVVDHALPLVHVYSSRIAALESRVLLEARPKASLTKELHLLSNDLKLLRRTLVPTQHLVHKLQSTHEKDNNQGFLSQLTVLYLSDVYDHISTVVEDMISLAEDAKDLIDLIFNTISHNNNSSMQMLAVVSTIFLPITFLAGVYGTNFDQWFPEIHWPYGYAYFWAACIIITVGFFRMLQRWGMFDDGGSSATD